MSSTPRQLGKLDVFLSFLFPDSVTAYATDRRGWIWFVLFLSFIPYAFYAMNQVAKFFGGSGGNQVANTPALVTAFLETFTLQVTLDEIFKLDDAFMALKAPAEWKDRILSGIPNAFWVSVQGVIDYYNLFIAASWQAKAWVLVTIGVQIFIYLMLVGIALIMVHGAMEARGKAEFRALARGLEPPPSFPTRRAHWSDFFLCLFGANMAIALHSSCRTIYALSAVSFLWSQWWLGEALVTILLHSLYTTNPPSTEWAKLIFNFTVYGVNVAVAVFFLLWSAMCYRPSRYDEEEGPSDVDSEYSL